MLLKFNLMHGFCSFPATGYRKQMLAEWNPAHFFWPRYAIDGSCKGNRTLKLQKYNAFINCITFVPNEYIYRGIPISVHVIETSCKILLRYLIKLFSRSLLIQRACTINQIKNKYYLTIKFRCAWLVTHICIFQCVRKNVIFFEKFCTCLPNSFYEKNLFLYRYALYC